VGDFKVVNPATSETEREFAAATDAEVERCSPVPRGGVTDLDRPAGRLDPPYGPACVPWSAVTTSRHSS